LTLTAYPSKLSADLLEVRLEGNPLPRPQQVLKLKSQDDPSSETVFCEVVSVTLIDNKAGEMICKVALKVLNGSPTLTSLKATILDQAELAKAAHSLLAPVQHPILIGAKEASEPSVDFFRLGPLSLVDGGNELSVRVSALMQVLRGIQPYQRILLIDPVGVVMPSDPSAHIRAGQDGSLALQQVSGKRFLEVFAETLPEFLQEAGLRTVASILPQSSRGNKSEFVGFQSLMALEALTEAPLRNLILQTLYSLQEARVFAEKPEQVLSFKRGLPAPITILDLSMLPDPWKGFVYAEICQRALQEIAGELVLAMIHPEIYLSDWPKWIQHASEEELNYLVIPSPYRIPSNALIHHSLDWKTSANNVFTVSTDAHSFTVKGDLTLGLPIKYALTHDQSGIPSTSLSKASLAAWQAPFDEELLPEYPSELRQALSSKERNSRQEESENDVSGNYDTYDDDDFEDEEYDEDDDQYLDEEDEGAELSDSELDDSDDEDSDISEDEISARKIDIHNNESDSEKKYEAVSDVKDEIEFETEDQDEEDDEHENETDSSIDESKSSEELDEEVFDEQRYYSSYLGEQEASLVSSSSNITSDVSAEANFPLLTDETVLVEEVSSAAPLQESVDDGAEEKDVAEDDDAEGEDEFDFGLGSESEAMFNNLQAPGGIRVKESTYQPSYILQPEANFQGLPSSEHSPEHQSPSEHQGGKDAVSNLDTNEEEDDFGDEESGDFGFNFDATLYEPSWLTPASNWQSPQQRSSQKAKPPQEESYTTPPQQQESQLYHSAAPAYDNPSNEEQNYPDYSNPSGYEEYEDEYSESTEAASDPGIESAPDEEIPVVTRNAVPKVPAGYFVGERVRHPQYGLGTITKILPMAEQVILNITFDQVGKRLLDPSLCELTREEGEK
jgi:hypothetical protein